VKLFNLPVIKDHLVDASRTQAMLSYPLSVFYMQDFAFPRVERDIRQIEQFSQRLRSQAARGDPTTETIGASRLLAQEGLDPRR